MGGAASIDSTPYDEGKFLESKAIMESAADDSEKFSKLKLIWAEGGGAPHAADDHSKSVKEDGHVYHEEHKEDGHVYHEEHKDDGQAHKEGEHVHHEEHHKDDGHAHKEGEHHDGHEHKEAEHHHQDDGHNHKEGEHTHKEETHAHEQEAHAPKEEGHAEAPKDGPKSSASTGSLPTAPSEHHSDKHSRET